MRCPTSSKIGDIVNYNPADQLISTARGTYTVAGLMPVFNGKQPEYRISRPGEDFERVALEIELSPG